MSISSLRYRQVNLQRSSEQYPALIPTHALRFFARDNPHADRTIKLPVGTRNEIYANPIAGRIILNLFTDSRATSAI